MDNILAKIYSTGDSWRRAVVDVFTNPADAVNRTAARMKEDSDALQADIKTALPATNPGGKSVLVKEKEQAAAWAGIQPVIDNLMGMGIIVPIEAAYPKMKRGDIEDLIREMDIDPASAYEKAGAYRQPLSGRPVVNISDVGQRIDPIKIATTGGVSNLRPKREGGQLLPTRVPELIDTSRYPSHLQEYLANVSVWNQARRGGSFDPNTTRITLGPGSEEDLTSVLLHEMQHAAQYFYDMPRGGNMREFFKDYGKFSTAKVRAQQVMEDLAKKGISPQGSISPPASWMTSEQMLQDPDTVSTILDMLNRVEKQGYSNYRNIAGEVEARLVQELFENASQDLPLTIMRRDMRVSPTELIDPSTISLRPKVDADPITESIIRTLRGE